MAAPYSRNYFEVSFTPTVCITSSPDVGDVTIALLVSVVRKTKWLSPGPINSTDALTFVVPVCALMAVAKSFKLKCPQSR